MNEVLTSDELAKIYKVTRGTINNWRKEGMPYKKIGKLVRFDIEEVKKWIDAKK